MTGLVDPLRYLLTLTIHVFQTQGSPSFRRLADYRTYRCSKLAALKRTFFAGDFAAKWATIKQTQQAAHITTYYPTLK
jgi:hypothetical protein